jgi:thiol-disulfide isomerase/thioredoxin
MLARCLSTIGLAIPIYPALLFDFCVLAEVLFNCMTYFNCKLLKKEGRIIANDFNKKRKLTMMKRNLTILFGTLILVAIVIFQNTGSGVQAVFQMDKPLPTESGPVAGLLAPSFSATGLDGNMYEVGGEREKAIIVNFWASWCDPCKQEAPDLVRIADKYQSDLMIYGVNVTKFDNKKNANKFIKKYQLDFPVMLDPQATLFDQYAGAAFPTNVLIDKHGVIQEIILGTVSAKELEKKVEKLIES